MMPMAPALETAEASADRAIQPMGACTMGISTPRSSVTRLVSIGESWHDWVKGTQTYASGVIGPAQSLVVAGVAGRSVDGLA